MLRMALTCHVRLVSHIATLASPSVSVRRTLFSFSGFLSVRWKNMMIRSVPRHVLPAAGARPRTMPCTQASAPALPRCERWGKPRQFSPGAIGGARRAGAHPAQTRLSGPGADRLAAGGRNRPAIAFERVGGGQSGRLKAGRRVCIAYHLTAGQGAPHQYRPRVVAQVFGLVGPLIDKGAKVQADFVSSAKHLIPLIKKTAVWSCPTLNPTFVKSWRGQVNLGNFLAAVN